MDQEKEVRLGQKGDRKEGQKSQGTGVREAGGSKTEPCCGAEPDARIRVRLPRVLAVEFLPSCKC